MLPAVSSLVWVHVFKCFLVSLSAVLSLTSWHRFMCLSVFFLIKPHILLTPQLLCLLPRFVTYEYVTERQDSKRRCLAWPRLNTSLWRRCGKCPAATGCSGRDYDQAGVPRLWVASFPICRTAWSVSCSCESCMQKEAEGSQIGRILPGPVAIPVFSLATKPGDSFSILNPAVFMSARLLAELALW